MELTERDKPLITTMYKHSWGIAESPESAEDWELTTAYKMARTEDMEDCRDIEAYNILACELRRRARKISTPVERASIAASLVASGVDMDNALNDAAYLIIEA
ncbi:hypothetical protein [Citrobacter portucalensis]|uniref:Uncharacterized protein n=1 Tax=Citrobacter portucalensis TaxID=1639133 RepID=A0AAW9EJQ4_9ENTR|nr:hypothetical protein [Citrobacter portucalensis]MCS1418728.1 hypothetical protein [Citrobacter portucalensis]MDX7146380.1 hypothetical protein [Citrobacter portucalensis]HBK6102201.1 hypothetical protein [Citrobacter freundii]